MKRVLVVLALSSVLIAAGSGSVTAAGSRTTVRIKGGRPQCSVDGHRARSCSRIYRLKAGHTLRIRAHGRAGIAVRLAMAVGIAGRGPMCSVDGHRARPCMRRYRVRAGHMLSLATRPGTLRRRRPGTGAPISPPGAPANGAVTPGTPGSQSLDGCPAAPTGNVTSDAHTWMLEGQDGFTKDAAIGTFGSDGSGPVYTGDHGMRWSEYGDGWTSTYTNGAPGYEPSVVQSVHNGVLDWYLHNYNGTPVSANPSPLPGGHQYQTYGRYSLCERIVPADSHRLDDFYQAILLWPQSDGDWQSAESDFPEDNLSGPRFEAFAHHGGSGAQDSFTTGNIDTTQWHVYTQEWGPGFRNYYMDGTLIGRSTNQVTASPERWQLQVEPSGSNDGGSGHVFVGWVAIWGY
jgi:hypothetical protein